MSMSVRPLMIKPPAISSSNSSEPPVYARSGMLVVVAVTVIGTLDTLFEVVVSTSPELDTTWPVTLMDPT